MAGRTLRLTLIALLLGLAHGCAEVRLISDYDEVTDRSVTALQRDLETLLTTLERNPQPPACLHVTHADTYAAMEVDLNLLLARNAGRPDNSLTERQLVMLRDSIDTLEELHRSSGDACLSNFSIAPLRSAFNSSFTAILKLEFAKKRLPATKE